MFGAYDDGYGRKKQNTKTSEPYKPDDSLTLMAHRPGSTNNIAESSTKYFDFVLPKNQIEKNRAAKLAAVQNNLRELQKKQS